MKRWSRVFAIAFVMVTLMTASVFAAPVSEEQVQTAVETFITVRYPAAGQTDAQTVTPVGSSNLQVASVEPWIFEGQTIGFIAHLSPGGYVLMRADDLAPPLKLYINNGHFAELPPDFVEILQEELTQELQYVNDADNAELALGNSTFQKQWTALLNPTADHSTLGNFTPPALGGGPLLSATWSQGDPYNYYTPTASGAPSYADGRAVTGCVATAMAQIMHFHQWPAAISGNATYTDSAGSCQGTHSASDAGLGNYDWANMPNSPSSSSPLAQQKAVGQLMYHAGVTVEMNYEGGGSGAYSSNVDNALQDSFSYSTGNLESRSSYSSGQWYGKINTDVNAQRPIYYSFRDVNGKGGHAVVVDGARNGNEIHVNMGWGSYCDAWYNMDSVNTSNGYAFNDTHQAIFEIQPTGQTTPTYTITASAGSGGSISPSGTVNVEQGANQSFTISANSGYQITDVTVDGVSVGVRTSYTFSNMTANHTITASFEEIPVTTSTITATAGSGGSISPSGEVTLEQGANQSFTISANSGYQITDVTVDGVSVGIRTSYTFTNVTANHTIEVSFAPEVVYIYTISASSGPNGSISPQGEIEVTEGQNQSFTMVPDSGYQVADVTVDGLSQGGGGAIPSKG